MFPAKKEVKEGTKGWKSGSKDGKYLEHLIKNNKVSAGITAGALKEDFPQFKKYKSDAFAAALRRLRKKYGSNVRGESGESFLYCCLCFLLLFFEFLYCVVSSF